MCSLSTALFVGVLKWFLSWRYCQYTICMAGTLNAARTVGVKLIFLLILTKSLLIFTSNQTKHAILMHFLGTAVKCIVEGFVCPKHTKTYFVTYYWCYQLYIARLWDHWTLKRNCLHGHIPFVVSDMFLFVSLVNCPFWLCNPGFHPGNGWSVVSNDLHTSHLVIHLVAHDL